MAMVEHISVEDVTLSVQIAGLGGNYPALTNLDDKGIATLKEVTCSYSQARKYRKQWGSLRNWAYQKGEEKVTGKLTFETLTPMGWLLLRGSTVGVIDPTLTIKGIFTDNKWSNTVYIMSVYEVQIDSHDFQFNSTDGVLDIPLNYTAQYAEPGLQVAQP